MMSRSSEAAGYAVPPAPVTTRTTLGSVEHTDSGRGRTLLALHGAMGGYDQSWLLARAILADLADYRLLGLSRPGYLATPLSLGSTPEAQADLYAALLDALGIERTLVAAVSAGGPSAIQFALRHPARCEGLILVSAPNGPMAGAADNLARIRRLARMSRIPGFLPLLRWQARRRPEKGIVRAVPDIDLRARLMAHHAAYALLLAVQQGTMNNLPRRLPGTLNDTELFGSIASLRLRQLSVPVLVVHAADDPVVNIDNARRVLHEATGAQGLILPSGGHMALFGHLDNVRTAIADFLAG